MSDDFRDDRVIWCRGCGKEQFEAACEEGVCSRCIDEAAGAAEEQALAEATL